MKERKGVGEAKVYFIAENIFPRGFNIIKKNLGERVRNQKWTQPAVARKQLRLRINPME